MKWVTKFFSSPEQAQKVNPNTFSVYTQIFSSSYGRYNKNESRSSNSHETHVAKKEIKFECLSKNHNSRLLWAKNVGLDSSEVKEKMIREMKKVEVNRQHADVLLNERVGTSFIFLGVLVFFQLLLNKLKLCDIRLRKVDMFRKSKR